MKVFEIVNDIIMQKLASGAVPWQKPWAGHDHAPKNLISGKEYRGINAFILGSSGYASPYWVTYKQAVSLKGQIRKGEHGTPIFFWNFIKKTGTVATPAGDKSVVKNIPFLRYYTGFNVTQCDLPEGAVPVVADVPATVVEQNDAAELVLASFKDAPRVTWNTGSRACYSPLTDEVMLPAKEAFVGAPEMYCTLFHELGHSTGHKTRLDREMGGGFGSKDYAREELIAEMTAAYLCGECAITGTFDNSAAYIQSWQDRLKDDQYLFITAAGRAQAAVDHILGTKPEYKDEE